jgi:DNA-binding response OmpR family regulator
MLPGIDGFELMERIKKYSIPIIFLTAKADVLSKIQGLRGGAEDYIVKPFEILVLLVRIEKILERAGKLNVVLYYKDIIVNLNEHSVMRAGEEIFLKPLEFDLLVMLIKYKNRTIPRERLLNEIWGVDFVGGTRTVDVHIAQLRKKLNLHDEIRSASKIGYRLEDV